MNKETIKLAFIGTSCIGKTTLLNELRRLERGKPDVAFVSEAARQYFSENPTADRSSEVTQEQIQALVIEMEQVAHSSGARIIFCDRSAIDAVAYLKSSGNEEGVVRLLSRIVDHLSTYRRLLLLDPLDIPFAQDEVRSESEEERNGFHRAFLVLFEEQGVAYELLSGTLEERIQKVYEIINDFQDRSYTSDPGSE